MAQARQEIDRAWEIAMQTEHTHINKSDSCSQPNHRQKPLQGRSDALLDSPQGVQAEVTMNVDVVPMATLRATFQLEANEVDAALTTLVQAKKRRNGPHPDLSFLRGVCHETQAAAQPDTVQRTTALTHAEDCYQYCLDQAQQVFTQELNPPGCTSWAAATRMGTVRLLLEQPTAALHAFDQALAQQPEHAEAQLGRAESLLDAGQAQQALRQLEPLLAADTADAWYLLVLVCANVGHTARLAELLPKAMAKAATTNFLAPHRRQRLNALADQTSSNRQA
jgi:predicted Zn-dependent protease